MIMIIVIIMTSRFLCKNFYSRIIDVGFGIIIFISYLKKTKVVKDGRISLFVIHVEDFFFFLFLISCSIKVITCLLELLQVEWKANGLLDFNFTCVFIRARRVSFNCKIRWCGDFKVNILHGENSTSKRKISKSTKIQEKQQKNPKEKKIPIDGTIFYHEKNIDLKL